MKTKQVYELAKLFEGKVDTPITYAYILSYLQDKARKGKKTIDGRALYKYNPSLKTTYKVILKNLQTMGFIKVLRLPELEYRVYFELNEGI